MSSFYRGLIGLLVAALAFASIAWCLTDRALRSHAAASGLGQRAPELSQDHRARPERPRLPGATAKT